MTRWRAIIFRSLNRRANPALIAGFAMMTLGLAVPPATSHPATPDTRAAQTLAQMTLDEKLALLEGFIPQTWPAGTFPADIPSGSGFVRGVPRLGVPALAESDASLGVANMGGFMRAKDEATAMPAGLAMASTWDPKLIEQVGRVMGAETRAKGFNVLLAGGINLVRDPRGGRAFEYFSEDPLLSGVLGGYSVLGIQSAGVISTVKHFALNANETGRSFADVRISEQAMRESDLLAFELAIEIGRPGAVMCAYNKINSAYACENAFLLKDVLRRDWGYKGFVMSDWGAVHSVSIDQGLDQESGTQPRKDAWFAKPLRDAIASGAVTTADVDRAVLRILRTIYALNLPANGTLVRAKIDFSPNLDLAQRVAEQGIVLLKNDRGILPLAKTAKRILVVGGHADKGVPQGAGSSQVWPVGGSALSLRYDDKPYHYRLYMPSPPLAAIKAQYPGANVTFDDGSEPARAAKAAKDADVVIVFGEQFRREGRDVPDLDLPDGQNALISGIAEANPHTIVVLETGGPVAMPWIGKVAGVLQAWYPGNRGGEAIARVISGAVSPSGRLPVTFPLATAQLPNPVLPGQALIDAAKDGDVGTLPKERQVLAITFPEGADVGYRWYARQRLTPLFPFGFGLSYTSFSTSALAVDGSRAIFTVRNTGPRAGAYTAQLYLVSRGGKPIKRLVAFDKVDLAKGESKKVSVRIDPRTLADWDNGKWVIPAGRYSFGLRDNAISPGLDVAVRLAGRRW